MNPKMNSTNSTPQTRAWYMIIYILYHLLNTALLLRSQPPHITGDDTLNTNHQHYRQRDVYDPGSLLSTKINSPNNELIGIDNSSTNLVFKGQALTENSYFDFEFVQNFTQHSTRSRNSSFVYLKIHGADVDRGFNLLPAVSHQTNTSVLVEYHVMHSDVNLYNSEIFCKTKSHVFYQMPELFERHCSAELFEFGNQDSEGLNMTSIYCGIKSLRYVPKPLENTSEIAVNIYTILPHQSYEFNATLFLGDVQIAKAQHFHCMSSDIPPYPPQADFASYSLNTRNRSHLFDGNSPPGSNQELIELYWRTLPKLLSGADGLKYDVDCVEENSTRNHTLHGFKDYTGFALIEKAINATSTCYITARNLIGSSLSSSRIVIPARAQMVDLGRRFTFVAHSNTDLDFLLEWSPFIINVASRSVEVLPRNTKAKISIPGYFTIYWCIIELSPGCNSLRGMIKLNTSMTSYRLRLPNYSKSGKMLFGISYTLKPPDLNTGIIWAKCIVDPEHESMVKPLVISVSPSTKSSHRSLSIAWIFPYCDSVISKIKHYEIRYCKVSQLDGCSILWHNSPPMEEPSGSAISDECVTINVPNRFINEQILTGLSPSTRYNISIRYILEDTLWSGSVNCTLDENVKCNPWSINATAYTAPEPEMLRSCWHDYYWIVAISCLVFTAISLLICMRWRLWYRHLRSLVIRYKKTRATVSNTMSGFSRRDSEMSLNYCVNKARSESSLNMLDRRDRFQSGKMDLVEENLRDSNQQTYIDQTFEYIPRKLVEGNQDEATGESCSDSAREATKFEISSDDQDDDISINSHSSFLQNILEEQSDLNNNNHNMNYSTSNRFNTVDHIDKSMSGQDLKRELGPDEAKP